MMNICSFFPAQHVSPPPSYKTSVVRNAFSVVWVEMNSSHSSVPEVEKCARRERPASLSSRSCQSPSWGLTIRTTIKVGFSPAEIPKEIVPSSWRFSCYLLSPPNPHTPQTERKGERETGTFLSDLVSVVLKSTLPELTHQLTVSLSYFPLSTSLSHFFTFQQRFTEYYFSILLLYNKLPQTGRHFFLFLFF